MAAFIDICLFFTISAQAQSGELKPFNENGKVGYKDENGNIIIQSKYEKGLEFSEGLAAVKQNDKWGYIDKSGEIVIPCEYINVKSFSEGLAAVVGKKGKLGLPGKWGYIDKTGQIVIPCEYDGVENFANDFAMVSLHVKYYIIDKSGNRVFSRNKLLNTIHESSLLPGIEEIDKYNSKLNRWKPNNSVSFQIKRPYLALSTDYYHKIEDAGELLEYSGTDLDEKSINNVKTIIGAYQYPHDSKTYSKSLYKSAYNYDRSYTIESYGEIIIYYDVDSKKVIGYDIIKGEDLNLPSNMTEGDLIGYPKLYIKPDEIINQIKSHLANSSANQEE